MHASDFSYDGKLLSDFGFVICDFDSSGTINTTDTGAEISFKQSSRDKGRKNSLVDSVWNDTATASFSICKDPCQFEDNILTDQEYINLTRWLVRRDFHKICFIDDAPSPYTQTHNRFYNGSFTHKAITFEGKMCGLELTMTTDTPYAYSDEIQVNLSADSAETDVVTDTSSIVMDIIPNIEITCNEDCNLSIKNTTNNSYLTINNCMNGEVITIDGNALIITTNLNSHKIYDDFDYNFVTVTLGSENKFTCSQNADLVITYNPVYYEAL